MSQAVQTRSCSPRRLTTSAISEWRAVWLVVMFDLPMVSKSEKRQYVRFRSLLFDEGFSMLQFSVYGRHHATRERAEATVRRIVRGLPKGEIRVLRVTEVQFARMEVFSNFDRRPPESAPSQLELW